MEKINEIADGYVKEAAVDYVGLWQIASRVRWDFKSSNLNDEQVKTLSLEVVRLLVNRGLLPGDYLKTGFHFWDERGAGPIIARIDKEWDMERGDPNLADPICWFSVAPTA